MDGVTELVEERGRVIERDQYWLARCAVHEIVVVRGDRRDQAVEGLVALIHFIPSA